MDGRRAALVALLSAALAALRWKLGGRLHKLSSSAIERVPRKPSPLGGVFIFRNKTAFNNWSSSVVWLEPFRHLPFTPVLTCEPGDSVLMSRFDWQLVPEPLERNPNLNDSYSFDCGVIEDRPWRSVAHVRDPRTVWASPHSLPMLLELATRDFDPARSDRVVVFSGTEMPLSRAFGASRAQREATVAKLRKYFNIIRFMTMDFRLEGVGLAPMGLCWGYTLVLLDHWMKIASGRVLRVAGELMHFEAALRGDLSVKNKSILLTRGVWASWLDRKYTLRQAENLSRQGLLFPPSNSSLRAVMASVDSRAAARAWAESSAGRALGVELRRFDVPEWWQELPRYRFLINPMGSGVQTAKSFEALLVLTIPIVQHMAFPAFEELVRFGFPIVVVSNWTEITRETTGRWWNKLAPRLESFRRNCLTVDGYWRMYTGTVARCE